MSARELRRWTWAVPLLALWAGGCDGPAEAKRTWQPSDHGQPAAAPDDGRAVPEQAAEGGPLRAARALFKVSCASCHGLDGRGGGAGLPPGAKAPNLADLATMSRRSDTDLSAVITAGRGMMPAFGDRISPAGVKALVMYIRTLSAAQAPTEPAAAAPKPAADGGAAAEPPATAR